MKHKSVIDGVEKINLTFYVLPLPSPECKIEELKEGYSLELEITNEITDYKRHGLYAKQQK